MAKRLGNAKEVRASTLGRPCHFLPCPLLTLLSSSEAEKHLPDLALPDEKLRKIGAQRPDPQLTTPGKVIELKVWLDDTVTRHCYLPPVDKNTFPNLGKPLHLQC